MKKRKTVILGAGLVGGPMASDLARDEQFEVTAVDVSSEALDRLRARDAKVNIMAADLSDLREVTALVKNFDLVISAVPGHLGFQTLEAVIAAKKNVVDIAFFAENPFALDALARENGVVAVVDCGVAPGMSNLLAGHAKTLLDETARILIYVGGLPETRHWPYEYKAVFSPIDVIAEYTRPARYVENGRPVVRAALSDPESLDFPGIGTLEAFNTDGLRTLAATLDVPHMKEKTLRYPGHIEKMAMLRETGFFDTEEIEVGGARIKPIDFTARLLFPRWKLAEGEADLTVMKVIVEGTRDGRKLRYTYDLLDRYDAATSTHSMARATGYTATVALRLLARGLYDRPGVTPPEFLGRHQQCVDFMLAGLAKRGVIYHETVEGLAESR